MAFYELKTFDAAGRLVGRTAFGAFDDAEAGDVADLLRDTRASELWCGHRLVQASGPMDNFVSVARGRILTDWRPATSASA